MRGGKASGEATLQRQKNNSKFCRFLTATNHKHRITKWIQEEKASPHLLLPLLAIYFF